MRTIPNRRFKITNTEVLFHYKVKVSQLIPPRKFFNFKVKKSFAAAKLISADLMHVANAIHNQAGH